MTFNPAILQIILERLENEHESNPTDWTDIEWVWPTESDDQNREYSIH